MNKFFKIFTLLLTVILLVTLCGCSKYDSKANIYFELNELPKTLDAQTAESVSELIAVRNIYEGLTRKNEAGDIVLGVAESYEYKNLTYTFQIKEDAVWSDGTPLTAYDFLFAIKRAVLPETNAPFVYKLYSIKNARAISEGNASINSLGVSVLGDYTIRFQLEYEDENFLHTLSTSVAMPCNEEFFKNSIGKYGLNSEYIISNGSYKLSRWNQENFKIKLSKNDNYIGDFQAKNGAVFLTRNEEETAISLLQNDDVDASFIDCALTKEAENSQLKTHSFENTCWILTISNEIPYNIRKSLAMLCGGEFLNEKMEYGFRIADSLFPSVCLSRESTVKQFTKYDLTAAKKIYMESVKEFEDKKFPTDTYLSYYDNGYFKNSITALVGHWQNHLGAYVNIEETDSLNKILGQLNNQTKVMAIFPIVTPNNDIAEYLKKFNFDYKGQDVSVIQEALLKNYNIVPLAFSNTTIAYGNGIDEITFDTDNGYIDFSFVKKQK